MKAKGEKVDTLQREGNNNNNLERRREGESGPFEVTPVHPVRQHLPTPAQVRCPRQPFERKKWRWKIGLGVRL